MVSLPALQSLLFSACSIASRACFPYPSSSRDLGFPLISHGLGTHHNVKIAPANMTTAWLQQSDVSHNLDLQSLVSSRGSYIISAHPSQCDRKSLTPLPLILASARKICVAMLPSFPAAADTPWHVARNFVGKTSAAICERMSERLIL